MIWLVAHFDHDGEDWAIDFVGSEERARDMLNELHRRQPARLYHLFCEVEAVSEHFHETETPTWQILARDRRED